MATTLLLIAAGITLLGLAWRTLTQDRTDETDRFHRAREITSAWAEPGPRLQTVPAYARDAAEETRTGRVGD